jgi:hypothetical protein
MIHSSADFDPRPVLEDFGRETCEGERIIYLQGHSIFAELHLRHPLREWNVFSLDVLKRPRLERFVLNVKAGELAAGARKGGEIGGEGNAGQFAFEVLGIALAIFGMMQQGVDVVENVFVCDCVIGVVLAELRDGAVFEMGDGEALGAA